MHHCKNLSFFYFKKITFYSVLTHSQHVLFDNLTGWLQPQQLQFLIPTETVYSITVYFINIYNTVYFIKLYSNVHSNGQFQIANVYSSQFRPRIILQNTQSHYPEKCVDQKLPFELDKFQRTGQFLYFARLQDS
jgi:hypothetical protein